MALDSVRILYRGGTAGNGGKKTRFFAKLKTGGTEGEAGAFFAEIKKK